MASMVGEPKEVLDTQCRNAPQRVTLGQVTLIGIMIRQHVKSKVWISLWPLLVTFTRASSME